MSTRSSSKRKRTAAAGSAASDSDSKSAVIASPSSTKVTTAKNVVNSTTPSITTSTNSIINPNNRQLISLSGNARNHSLTKFTPISSAAAKNIPAFLNKLYNMVSDPSSSDLIHWSDDGQAFIVERHEEFAHNVLPRFFKHNNFSSFVRQLNMYGFHKIPHLQAGSLMSEGEAEVWEFANPHFQRNQPDLLCLVTRKKGQQSGETTALETTAHASNAAVDISSVVNEIAAVKRHQLTISADLKTLQNENQMLWGQTMELRDRYQKQQETVNKILRFLASIFSARKQPPAKAPVLLKKRRLIVDGSDSVDSILETDANPLDSDDVLSLDEDEPAVETPIINPMATSSKAAASTTSTPATSATSANLPTIIPTPIVNPTYTPIVPAPDPFDKLVQGAKGQMDRSMALKEDIDLLDDHLASATNLLGLDPLTLDHLDQFDINSLFMNNGGAGEAAPAAGGASLQNNGLGYTLNNANDINAAYTTLAASTSIPAPTNSQPSQQKDGLMSVIRPQASPIPPMTGTGSNGGLEDLTAGLPAWLNMALFEQLSHPDLVNEKAGATNGAAAGGVPPFLANKTGKGLGTAGNNGVDFDSLLNVDLGV
ncbi:stress-responsive transcription factor hsf1 [Chytridiales sp. JEL 0842]|nr:stress-responsive transcription factor hsf1 [Chytridiales sp. JEL 0842]